MTTQQQERRSDQLNTRSKGRKRISRRSSVIITVLLLAVAIIIIWILSYFNVIQSFWVAIFTIIITVFGAVFALFQSMHLFLPAEKHVSTETSPYSNAKMDIPSIETKVALSSAKPAYRGIVGFPPPTDPRIIQQREQVVKEVYTKLTQSNVEIHPRLWRPETCGLTHHLFISNRAEAAKPKRDEESVRHHSGACLEGK